jgi:hypothetical protein
MTKKYNSRLLLLPLLLACLLVPAGCNNKDASPLTLNDLTGGEYVYVERMVILERAKTMALIDRAAGDAVLDSLAADWGDSSLAQTLGGVPSDPLRAEAVATLLRRILAAEQDSLRASSAFDRLARPLLDPPVPEPTAPSEENPATGN